MFEVDSIAWEKVDGLIPAIVQDCQNGKVLMLGYMSREALAETCRSGQVTFWSRSRQTLWTKGETSGHFLTVEHLSLDCDRDTLLIQATPAGPVCHQGTVTCFSQPNHGFEKVQFLRQLEEIIRSRRDEADPGSYTASLYAEGREKILQKLGEEAIEVIVSALQVRSQSVAESADLLFHLLVFLGLREVSLDEVVSELEQRHRSNTEVVP